MDKYDIVRELNDLIIHCLMPELLKDVGTEQITSDHFNEFRRHLDQNLLHVFDLVEMNQHFFEEEDRDFVEFQTKLVFLLCEQSSGYSYHWHQTKDKKLLDNINVLMAKHFRRVTNKNAKVSNQIMEYYKKKLTAATWKRNIGSVLGFLQFLETKHNILDSKIDETELTFILSVGLLLHEFFEPMFKEMAVKIFSILLHKADKRSLKELNIHNVIYEELKINVCKYDSTAAIQPVWDTLFTCLKIRGLNYTGAKFNDVDFLIQDLCHQIVLSKSFDIWLAQVKILITIFLEVQPNTINVDHLLVNEHFLKNISQIRIECLNIKSVAAYRWGKTMLEFLVAESNYLMGVSSKTIHAINAFHLCFLVCILPMEINVCDELLENFFKKFSPILTEVLKQNKGNVMIYNAVEEFYNSFIFHIATENLEPKIIKYKILFEEVVQYIRSNVNTNR